MSRHRQTLVWMAGLSLVTLCLGVAREFAIARELRASGAADLFFRGLVVIGVARGVSLSLYRARFIVLDRTHRARDLLTAELKTCLFMFLVASLALLPILGTDAAIWTSATPFVIVVCVALSVFGGAIRALAERAGFERRGFMLEWAVPIGTIIGALWLGQGALGPTVGITTGMLLGGLALLPVAFGDPPGADKKNADTTSIEATSGNPLAKKNPNNPHHTRWLLLDTLLYVNLGLLDAGLSHLYPDGDFARLNYALLFVNAALMVPTAAATVVSLRVAAEDPEGAAKTLRKWAGIGGVFVGGAVAMVAYAMTWSWLASALDRAAGWPIASELHALILVSTPFAALRFANTVGRQHLVAHNPKRLLPWDIGGVALRALIIVVTAATIGVHASLVAMALAELVQLFAWWRPGQR